MEPLEPLQQRIAAAKDNGVALLAALREKVAQLNLPGEAISIPEFDAAQFSLEYDKYNGQQTLMASFYPAPHYRAGVVLFHSDGSCFAEYHVMRPHPAKPQWFIESVEAWVSGTEIKTDTRLALIPK
jgi:hypothetical protein